MSWSKGVASWIEGNTAFVSCPFTWKLQDAHGLCLWYKSLGFHVKAGGPAVALMPAYLEEVAEIGGAVNALPHHNPDAVFTSRGCVRNCPFCAVPKVEGELRELSSWEPRPIVCDNNLLACSRSHFDKVIDSLKSLKAVDFNQGLDSRLLKRYHAERLAELDLACVRLAWDSVQYEQPFMDAVSILDQAGVKRDMMRVYVLIGFTDTQEDALYRLQTVKDMGMLPNPMRFHPLDALAHNSYVGTHWTEAELRRYMRYWARQNWLEHIPFEEYERSRRTHLAERAQPALEGL